MQSVLQNAPGYLPLVILGTFLTVVLSMWTLLGRISARFNKALEDKLGPLAREIKTQGERFEGEAQRLESHFDTAIRDYDSDLRKEITNIANSIRTELRQAVEKHNDLALKVQENTTTNVAQGREIQESKLDRIQLRRDMDGMKQALERFEGFQKRNQDQILSAIDGTKEKINDGQGQLSTRLARVEEALKFYAKVRMEEQ